MVVVITDETSFDQVDSHLICSLQLHGHNFWGTVFKVLAILFEERRHHFAINLQASAGGQGTTSTYPIDGDCEAVDTSAGNSEDTGLRIVAATQVDEDMLVDNELVVRERAKAAYIFVIVKSDWEGTTAGWKYTE